MFKMSERVGTIICKKTNRSLADISNMSIEQEITLVQSIRGKPLVFSANRDIRKIGRGNPLLARKRIRTMTYVDKRIQEICKK